MTSSEKLREALAERSVFVASVDGLAMNRRVKRKQTPWAVICREHGQVFLTEKEYDAQMDDPNALWKCPVCARQAEWDDANYEAMARDDEFAEEGTA